MPDHCTLNEKSKTAYFLPVVVVEYAKFTCCLSLSTVYLLCGNRVESGRTPAFYQ